MSDNSIARGLLTKANAEFSVPIATELDRPIVWRHCGALPLLSWPNYPACFEANCWVESLRARGLKANSISEYGYQIIPLIRYCSDNSLQLYELDEYHFSRFMQTLKAESKDSSSEPRSKERTGNIGRKSLDFLDFVGTVYSIPNYVGSEGPIKATKKIVAVKLRNFTRYVEMWQHPEVPVVKQTVAKRTKILDKTKVKALKGAIRSSKSQPYIRSRQRISVQILEESGARREEVAEIPIKSVLDAEDMSVPALLLTTSKKEGHAERLVEITPALLSILKDYIEFDLKPLLHRKGLEITNDTPLLMSLKTSKAIIPNTLTHEFHGIKKRAGIEGAVHPHQFRHMSVTNDRKKHFEKYPADEAISRVIGQKGTPEYALRSMQKHGHASIRSQEPYDHYVVTQADSSVQGSELASSTVVAALETVQEILSSGKPNKAKIMRAERLIAELLQGALTGDADDVSE